MRRDAQLSPLAVVEARAMADTLPIETETGRRRVLDGQWALVTAGDIREVTRWRYPASGMIAEESVIDRGGALWHRLAVRIERENRFGMQTPPREPTADEIRAAVRFCFGPERVAVHLHARQADATRWGDPFTVYLHALLIPPGETAIGNWSPLPDLAPLDPTEG
jgi:hypothetical protein